MSDWKSTIDDWLARRAVDEKTAQERKEKKEEEKYGRYFGKRLKEYQEKYRCSFCKQPSHREPQPRFRPATSGRPAPSHLGLRPSTVNPVEWDYFWDDHPADRDKCRNCGKWACNDECVESHIYNGICRNCAEKQLKKKS